MRRQYVSLIFVAGNSVIEAVITTEAETEPEAEARALAHWMLHCAEYLPNPVTAWSVITTQTPSLLTP